MSNLTDWQRYSRALFETDPMRTSCQENDCFDEYDRVAMCVTDRIARGESPAGALRGALSDWFGDEVLAQRDLSSSIDAIEQAGT